MEKIKILVFGALGKMGSEVIKAACMDADIQVIAAVDKKAASKSLNLPDGSGIIPLSEDLEQAIAVHVPHVVVDFSGHDAVMQAVRICQKNKVRMVIGTTGLTQEELNEMELLAEKNKIGIVYASNFALGAVLMIHLSKIAAKYFDYSEIIELHHEKKADAPSGTSITTAKEMIKARGKPFIYPQTLKETLAKTRGGTHDGVSIHSVRLPGMIAHQAVLFGGLGQTLEIRHDTISRECYMPGVMLAVKEVVKSSKLIVGLDKLLGL